ncbi:sensor histidine kinase [Flavobacterium ammoniigenes]|jgi:two-component system phosphate regulon sensor histidine kinase PhoR|nr:ATP-binding protein [Flavobacterium ammoniigenes]
MKKNFKRNYQFAIKSSSLISLFATFFGMILLRVSLKYDKDTVWIYGAIFFMVLFVFSFLVLQYRIERFIYNRIKKIYDDVALLDAPSLANQPIATDMETLSRKVKKFATDKKLEIEMLQVREHYRREFLGNVSHELKTPLFTVQGYLSTLTDGAFEDKTILKKYLDRAEKGVERLIYIVEDLDMISKLESGELNLEIAEFDIVELIQSIVDMLEMKASKKNISLVLEHNNKPMWVAADKDKLQQVIINLIVNSIKYGKEGGETEISVTGFTSKKILVRVTDNGEGIESQNIPRLFERFYRVNKSGSRSEGGSGLGLSIVKHIVEAHKQKIYVESEYGVGSEFSFTIDRASKKR